MTLPASAPRAPRIGQSTAIEQSRAVAEVQAAVLVAQNKPRDTAKAQMEIRTSCTQRYLAEKAFYSFKRANSPVNGATVHLARELARCWGNIQYSVVELERDDDRGQSEMLAYAWDLETNTRVEMRFVSPHYRSSVDGKKLTDTRDIYENNANHGARRMRECIFAVLPPWLVEDAKMRCRSTLERPLDEDGQVIPLGKRIADVVQAYAELNVTQGQLEANRDRPTRDWTAQDVADLGIIFRSIKTRETQIEDEFPTARVTAADIKKAAPASAPSQLPAATDPTPPPAEPATGPPAELASAPAASTEQPAEENQPAAKATQTQLTRIHAQLGELGVKDRAQKLPTVSTLIGRTLQSSSELSKDEAEWLSKQLKGVLADQDPPRAFDDWLSEMRIAAQQKSGGES